MSVRPPEGPGQLQDANNAQPQRVWEPDCVSKRHNRAVKAVGGLCCLGFVNKLEITETSSFLGKVSKIALFAIVTLAFAIYDGIKGVFSTIKGVVTRVLCCKKEDVPPPAPNGEEAGANPPAAEAQARAEAAPLRAHVDPNAPVTHRELFLGLTKVISDIEQEMRPVTTGLNALSARIAELERHVGLEPRVPREAQREERHVRFVEETRRPVFPAPFLGPNPTAVPMAFPASSSYSAVPAPSSVEGRRVSVEEHAVAEEPRRVPEERASEAFAGASRAEEPRRMESASILSPRGEVADSEPESEGKGRVARHRHGRHDHFAHQLHAMSQQIERLERRMDAIAPAERARDAV